MRINHNIAALNTYRQLNTASSAQSKSMEKLSSGLRINKAGDDAAGLAISEKMRGQIRGLDMASKNSQDGISMLQTAEGALNETHDILQRMKELATQAANDTNTTDDRGEIQKEINQLTSEINRIGNTTEFNTQKLLDGGEVQRSLQTPGASVGEGTVAVKEGTALTGSVDLSAATSLTINGEAVALTNTKAGGTAGVYDTSLDADKTALATKLQEDIDAVGALKDKFKVEVVDNKVVISSVEKGGTAQVDLTGSTAGDLTKLGLTEEKVTGTDAETSSTSEKFTATLQIGANKGQAFQIDIADMRASSLGISKAVNASDASAGEGTAAVKEGTALTGSVDLSAATSLTINGEAVALTNTKAGGTAGVYDTSLDADKTALATKLQEDIDAVGALKDKFKVEVVDNKVVISSVEKGGTAQVDLTGSTAGDLTKLGLTEEKVTGTDAETSTTGSFTSESAVTNGTTSVVTESALDVSNHANATSAIEVLDKAIAKVSGERSKLGAFQNRLEHTINNLNTSSENLTAAESRIRDVDYALAA